MSELLYPERELIAAVTPADRYPPPYINVSKHGEKIMITLRGDPTNSNFGPTVQASFTESEWIDFLQQCTGAKKESQ